MAALGRYIFSVTTAAIICSILLSILKKKSGAAVLVRLIGGLFLTFTVIAPVSDVNFTAVFETPLEYTSQGNLIAASGQDLAQEQVQEIIKERCEAYILDKAMSYQTQIDAEVTLSQDDIAVPTAVQLKGSVSPYVKSILKKWLQVEMGIPEENQIWTE